jgi:hypothetical protein
MRSFSFMFSKRTAGAFVFIGVTLPAMAQLQNADFEVPGQGGAEPQGWTVTQGKFMQDDKIHSNGRFAGKLDGLDGPAGAYQDVAVDAGKAYALTGKWRNGDKTADFDVVTASISWLDQLGGNQVGKGVSKDSGPVVGNWTPFQVSGIAPADAHAARITLKSRFGVGAFDNLSWGETDAASVQAPAASSVPPKLPAALNGNAIAGPAPAASSGGAAQMNWLTDLNAARQEAVSNAKPILLFFPDADSDLTSHFESQVFTNPAVQSAASRYVLVRLPFVQNKDLAYQLKVFRSGSIVTYDNKGTFKALIQDKLTADEVAAKLAQ